MLGGKRKKIHELMPDPLPKDDQIIARITETVGNNQFICLLETGESKRVSIPTRLKRIWIKKGSFVVVSLLKGLSVEGEICSVLFNDEIKELKKLNKWPSSLEMTLEDCVPTTQTEEDELFVNTNHYESDDD